jgi:hypothetical protein
MLTSAFGTPLLTSAAQKLQESSKAAPAATCWINEASISGKFVHYSDRAQ